MIHRQPSAASSDPNPGRGKKTNSRRSRERNTKRAGQPLNSRRLLVENLEQRHLMAGNPIGGTGTLPANFDVCHVPRNIGTVTATQINEVERLTALGTNDTYLSAQTLNLGNLPGQQNTIDVRGTVQFNLGSASGFQVDQDVYRVDLKAGDILDIGLIGAATSFAVLVDGTNGLTDEFGRQLRPGQTWFQRDTPNGGYGNCSPLMDGIGNPLQPLGGLNSNMAQVIPRDGTYYIRVTAQDTTTNYTLGLRTYRPITERLGVGQRQIVYLDFQGGDVPVDEFNFVVDPPGGIPVGGVFNVPTTQSILTDLGIEIPTAGYDAFVSDIASIMVSQFNAIGVQAFNGNFSNTGIGGQYGIEIRTSEDRDQFGNLRVSPLDDPALRPLTTRVVFGDNASFPGFGGLFGISQNIDVGNFRLDDTVLVFFDAHVQNSATFDRSDALSLLDVVALQVAGTSSHELAHAFGIFHTDEDNLVRNLIDTGSAGINELLATLGAGPDEVIGTPDDTVPAFRIDRFEPDEDTFGTQFVPQSLAHTLRSGSVGTGVTGVVFNDLNGNGVQATDPGISGVTVFLDLNANGLRDAGELVTVTDSSGGFTFSAPNTSLNVVAVAPSGFRATTAASVPVSAGGATGVSFGFTQTNPDVTGFKFEDLNFNGFRDPGEPGVAGAEIYADLDGDNLPDIGEPIAVTAADGSYTLDLPVLGRSYAIREVAVPGFERTVPLSGEHVILFTGAALTAPLNFGGRPSRDYGDAPDSYLTSRAQNGPSHGLLSGLTIGATIDRENDAQVSANGLGDDTVDALNNQFDDEDGVIISREITAAAGGDFEITLNNTTGQTAYLSAWIDLDRDGTFNQPNEKFVSDRVLGTGTHVLTVPAGGVVGDTFARFRYSSTRGLSSTSAANDGEVEDHQVRILTNAALANNDIVSVTRNSQSFPIDVLANDFDTASNPLTILTNGLAAQRGVVSIGTNPQTGKQRINYTPPTGYVGPDEITYRVRDSFGNVADAKVFVTVTFQTAAPIAIDDIVEVPSTSSLVPINVLANDISSIAGGLRLISVTSGSAGGRVNIIEGSQSVSYSPAAGFADSEQFKYTVEDSAGNTSTAQVTIVLTPGAFNNDLAEYSVRVTDLLGNERLTVQQNEEFFVEVSVDDLRNLAAGTPQGIASAFVDLIYSSDLLSTVDTIPGDNRPFDLTFGPRFQNLPLQAYQNGDPAPGILNEIGSTVPLAILQTAGTANDLASHTGPAVLFKVRMRASNTGLALLQSDPADTAANDTLLIEAGNLNQQEVLFNRQRFGSLELPITPSGPNFPSAVDDFFTIPATNPVSSTALRVLSNDLVPAGSTILEFNVDQAARGNAVVNTAGTPNNFNDDFIEYTPAIGQQGLDSFTYVLTVNSPTFGVVTSIARVDVVAGNVADALARYELSYVNEAGQPISTIRSGDIFGVKINAVDLRERNAIDPNFPTETEKTLFQGVIDLLYDRTRMQPTNTKFPSDKFDFDVKFANQYNQAAAVGVGSRAGIIDELGSLLVDVQFADLFTNELATVFFRAIGTGPLSVTSSPADRFPESDTLRVNQNFPVPLNQIIYGAAPPLTILGAGGEPLHNFSMPADVNADNSVTALDALLIINSLNVSTPNGESAPNGFTNVYFHDVNGDGVVTAIDALRVINELNGSPASGEPIVAAPVASLTSSTNGSLTSETVVGLGEQETESQADLAPASAVGAPSAASTSSLASSSSDEDEEDNDLLSLLADDVASVWS